MAPTRRSAGDANAAGRRADTRGDASGGNDPGMMSGPMMGISPDPLALEMLAAQQQVDQALARYQQTEDETERQAIKADLTTALEPPVRNSTTTPNE